VAKFSEPFTSAELYVNDQAIRDNLADGKNVKACLTFSTEKNQSILVKVGLSAISTAGARKNLEAEMPHWDFDKVWDDARAAWNAELEKILVEGGSEEQKTIFYTACTMHF